MRNSLILHWKPTKYGFSCFHEAKMLPTIIAQCYLSQIKLSKYSPEDPINRFQVFPFLQKMLFRNGYTVYHKIASFFLFLCQTKIVLIYKLHLRYLNSHANRVRYESMWISTWIENHSGITDHYNIITITII